MKQKIYKLKLPNINIFSYRLMVNKSAKLYIIVLVLILFLIKFSGGLK